MTGFYTKCCTGLKWVKMTKATIILGKMNQIKFKLLDHFNGVYLQVIGFVSNGAVEQVDNNVLQNSDVPYV